MFGATRPPPPSSARPPRYAIINRMAARNLRPIVLIFGGLACIWALAWGASEFRDISYDQKISASYGTIDIILGSLYMAVAVIEAYGIFAAVKARIGLVRIYTYLSLLAAILVTGIETTHLVLHFTLKQPLIDNCLNEVRGQNRTVDSGFGFDSTRITRPITENEAQDYCNSWWNKGTFRDIAWLLVAAILGFIFATVNLAYLRQLMDPALQRTQAPSAAYQMNATRYPQTHNVNIPGYNPYQSQSYGDYVPPYENAKPPGYTSGPGYGGYGHDDEKTGYNRPNAARDSLDADSSDGHNPFKDPTRNQQTYLPPAGAPPPGLETYAQNERSKDEGFDSAAIEAAIKKSEIETKGPGRSDDGAAGPSTR